MRDIKDIKIGKYTLTEIIERHQHWLKEDCENWKDMRADLTGVNLSEVNLSGVDLYGIILDGADLSGANLSQANLYGADLTGADLFGADLYEANLYGADLSKVDLTRANLTKVILSRANLSEANLTNANLSDANLFKAILYGANLSKVYLFGADLTRADLSGADLNGAYLYGAKLKKAKNIPYISFACPSDGAFIGWKKIYSFLIKLYIPASAKRCSGTTKKCRCDKAKVLGIYNLDGSKADTNKVVNKTRTYCIYEVGKMIYPDSFDDDRWNECSHGIHFFINKQDAINYKNNSCIGGIQK